MLCFLKVNSPNNDIEKEKNFLKNLLLRRDMSCSQNGNVGKLRDQNLIFRFFGQCLI